MPKVCDNKSVGMLVWDKDGRLLMIERKKYNPGFAVPAGHQDGDDPLAAAKKELSEEIGLVVETEDLEKILWLGLPNPCRREGGTLHDWTIFKVKNWVGEIKQSPDEVKSYFWADSEKIRELTTSLKEFAESKGISLDSDGHGLPGLVRATNEDTEWKENPGLEPPMYFLFKELRII